MKISFRTTRRQQKLLLIRRSTQTEVDTLVVVEDSLAEATEVMATLHKVEVSINSLVRVVVVEISTTPLGLPDKYVESMVIQLTNATVASINTFSLSFHKPTLP